MRIPLTHQRPEPGAIAAQRAAFTLTEIMVAMAIFALAIGGAIYAHLFGLRMHGITQSKLSSTQGAQSTLNRVKDEIRTAKIVEIGNGTATSFAEIALNLPQRGNAVQIYATTNTNTFVRYYLDDAKDELRRVQSGVAAPTVVAAYITNQVPFQAEDYRGTVLTNNQNNRVIKMTLEFYQLQHPTVKIGPGSLYDYYRLQTRITRRALK
ncbi:MAG TPA: prepilin-type N-terminal cleavage/methylation domain-containing protein [Verrucomicrobiae bacterium]|nr:prepilin-type N-terminal cleavage/methylation domain-containing protein [Verrucomicrobiae bacterium]